MVSTAVKVAFSFATIVVVGGGVWWATRPDPIEVGVRPATRGAVEATVANTRAGTVKARRRAGLAPAIPGTVVALPVHEGDLVEAGQLLLRLWSEDLAAELQLADAQTREARSAHEEACTRAAHAEREAARLEALQRDGIAAPEEADAASSRAVEFRAACKAAEAAIEVRAAHAETVEARLAQTELRTPFAGVVAEVNAELGEYVTPSPVGIPTPPAIDLIDRTSLYVLAPIDEVDAPRVRVGMEVRITLDALRGETFAGRVVRIAPYVLDVEKQARTVDVEVEFVDEAAAARLLPGYSADVEIVLERRVDVLRVPSESIDGEGRVLVFDEGTGSLRSVEIEAGIANWTYTEVLSGIDEGARVVVSRERAGAVEGAVVKATDAEPAR